MFYFVTFDLDSASASCSQRTCNFFAVNLSFIFLLAPLRMKRYCSLEWEAKEQEMFASLVHMSSTEFNGSRVLQGATD